MKTYWGKYVNGQTPNTLEHRLTVIEAGVEHALQAIILGATLMSGSLIILTQKIGKQNGRVNKLENVIHGHKQETEARQIFSRVSDLESWRDVEVEAKAQAKGEELGRLATLEEQNEKSQRNRKWLIAIITGLATGGSTIVGLVLKFVLGLDF